MSRKLAAAGLATAVIGAALWVSFSSTQRNPPPPLQLKSQPSGGSEPESDIVLVRVNITPRPVESLTLTVDGPCQVRPAGHSRVLATLPRLKASRVHLTKTGLRIGTQEFPLSRLEIVPQQDPGIWVGDHQYRGTVRLIRRPGGRLIAVNVLPLEQYIASVVDSEMPLSFPQAARKAQAIVARSYALYQCRRAPRNALFDLYASTRSQKYLGFQYRTAGGRLLAGESENSRRIARETRSMVCLHNGTLFCTYYSAVCGGRTLNGREVFADAAPLLQSVACENCREAKFYRWTVTVETASLQDALAESFSQRGVRFGTLRSLKPARQSGPGQLSMFEAFDGRSRHALSAEQLRTILSPFGVRSPHFQIEQRAGSFVFHGKGHGHGAGLCQWGARGLAIQGRTARQILDFYYPGVEVVILAP